jgi:hypothetical protein
MRQLSDSTRSASSIQASGKTRGIATSFTGEGYQDIVDQANTVSIKKIFNMYGVRLDENNRKTTCPFKSHKGGRESTASFYFYPDTNTYYCYGCRQGSKPVDFVVNMDKCNRTRAAYKILEKFSSDIDEDVILKKEDFSEKMEIMMQYSNSVRNFRINFPDEKSYNFIEKNCKIFDDINHKHDLSNEALRSVVSQLLEVINSYTP